MMLSLRRSATVTAGLVIAVCVLSACSNAVNSESGSLGTSGVEPATLAVETSNQFITLTNNAGKPIEDVRIAIQPIGSAPAFTSTLRRMENAEKRDISVGQFRSNDGTTFNPRIIRARQITVTATDIIGKKHEITRAWGR
jgi:hypothetical protein